MPFVQISLLEGKDEKYITAIGEGIHEALIYAFNIPDNDRFQLVNEYKKRYYSMDKSFMNVQRSDDTVIIYITLKKGRTVEMKKALYRRIVENLSENPGVRKEDALIILVDNELENWSFGNGLAQLVS